LRRHLARYHELIETLRGELAASGQTALLARLDEGLGAVLASDEPPDALAMMDDILRVMSARVTVRPSGHEFLVEGPETVLNAALRAGLAPSYGCGNGACGLCKARVVEGEVRQSHHFDYPLSAAEKAQNYVLLCSHTAVSDLVVEMIEAASPADIPSQEVVAKVRSVVLLAEHTALLHVQTPRSNRLRFLAGQGATLGIAGGTADFGGDYAIASCPCDDRNLLFHIPLDDPDDEFAQRVQAGAVRAGDAINVRGPWGDFVLRAESTRPILFICCDTAFAPVRSLVEHALSLENAESMALAWATTRTDGAYLANECRSWAGALDDFRFAHHAAQSHGAAASFAVAAAVEMCGDLAERDIYLAGPAAFVATAGPLLASAGAASDRVVTAVF
jgi:CDP-4-dehydro-6-deoxyglucose reductase